MSASSDKSLISDVEGEDDDVGNVFVTDETHVSISLPEENYMDANIYWSTPSYVAELTQLLYDHVPPSELIVGDDGENADYMVSLDTVERRWGLTANGVRDCVKYSCSCEGLDADTCRQRALALVPPGCSLLFALMNWARVSDDDYLSMSEATGTADVASSRLYVSFRVPVEYRADVPDMFVCKDVCEE